MKPDDLAAAGRREVELNPLLPVGRERAPAADEG